MSAAIALAGVLSLGYEGLPDDLEARRRAELEDFAGTLHAVSGLDVVRHGTVSDLDQAGALGQAIADSAPAALVVVASIAARADIQWALVEPVDAPVLAWGRPDHPTYPDGLTPIEHVLGSGPIGAQALGSLLARAGRTFLASDRMEPAEREVVWLRAAALVGELPQIRLGLVGGPFPGMLDCALDRAALSADLGLDWVELALEPGPLPPAPQRPAAPDVPPDLERRSLRLTAALLRAAEGVDGLAIRCHSPAVAQHPDFGVTACHATAVFAERGIPVACMGDEPTLVAMLVAQRLGGAAHYTEVDAYDEARDAVLLSNGGELCPALAVPGSVRPCANRFFAGSAGRGLAHAARLRPGAVTLVAFTPAPAGWRLISWQGALTEDAVEGFDVPHGFFRGTPAGHLGWSRFVEAGVPHHAALAAGHIGLGCRLLAGRLGIEHVAID